MWMVRIPLLPSLVFLCLLKQGKSGAERNDWRSGSDLSKLYDTATPNPTGSLSGPYFLQETASTVTGIRGKTTFLVCSIRNLANYTVSWVRHSDSHPLTIGGYTYTPDSRFTSVHKPSSENWVLEIRDTKPSDKGIYECQISTSPIRSLQYQLEISDSLTEILGSRERHLDKGSPFNISCRVLSYQQSIPYVLWYHDNKQINSEHPGSYRVSKLETGTEEYSSSLLVDSAQRQHSGRYHCVSPAGQSNNVVLHVHTEENAAELYLNHASTLSTTISINLIIFTLWLVLHRFPMTYGRN